MSLAALLAWVWLLVLVVSGGIASRARPIGPRPYRWGTFLGLVMAAFGAGLVLVMTIQLDGLSLFAIGGLALSVLTSAVGLLRRRRFGVVALCATPVVWALEILIHPLTASDPGALTLAGNTLAGGWILTLPNVPYFRKRWRLMTGTGSGYEGFEDRDGGEAPGWRRRRQPRA